MTEKKRTPSKELAAILSAEYKDTNDARNAVKGLFKDTIEAMLEAEMD